MLEMRWVGWFWKAARICGGENNLHIILVSHNIYNSTNSKCKPASGQSNRTISEGGRRTRVIGKLGVIVSIGGMPKHVSFYLLQYYKEECNAPAHSTPTPTK